MTKDINIQAAIEALAKLGAKGTLFIGGDLVLGDKIVQNGKINVNGDKNVVKKAKCRKHRGKGSKKSEGQTTVAATQTSPTKEAAPKYWLVKPQYKCDLLLACRSKVVDGKVIAVAVMKDCKNGSVAKSELTLEANGAFQLAPYIHVLENAKIQGVSICLDVFDFQNKEALDKLYRTATDKGIKVFGMTKGVKADDSADIAEMKKSLASISAAAKEVLDGIGTEAKAEEIAPAGEEPSSPAITPEVAAVNVVDKLSSLLPNREEATAAEPAEELTTKSEQCSEEDVFEGMDL